MSSFGGETPVNVPTFITGFNQSYTVPAGRYAKVFGYVIFDYAGTGTSPSFSIGNLSFTSDTNFVTEMFLLDEGQGISVNSGSVISSNIHLGIIEFNKP
jgi:hypothetical protein